MQRRVIGVSHMVEITAMPSDADIEPHLEDRGHPSDDVDGVAAEHAALDATHREARHSDASCHVGLTQAASAAHGPDGRTDPDIVHPATMPMWASPRLLPQGTWPSAGRCGRYDGLRMPALVASNAYTQSFPGVPACPR